MIKLGNVAHVGVEGVARKAFRTVQDCGQVAVFVGKTSEAAAVPYYHPEYDDYIQRHQKHLVGVYLYDEDPAHSHEASARLAADIACAHRGPAKRVTRHA